MTRAWYTYGNHFHWVDMEWLWGNGVLARSVDDMLAFVESTGAPGNLNFDGIGYEKLASEEPAALARLSEAVADGRIEIVGATYGQPYAQFHHGESAVRQLAYGVRSVVRLLGVRPRAYWEEEFSWFPQLPQLLTDAGYTGASLFFQWTWHTPELPKETVAAIKWRGVDGSEIRTLPRSDLNLHQWPEDVEVLIQSGEISRFPTPVIQQWLELLPSPEWMCRSEIVAPGVKRLLSTPGFDFKLGTLSTVLDGVAEDAPVREYSMDDVFHGMSLGKNGNRLHRLSRRLEHTLLAAEALSVRNGLFGRPYAQWSKYPAWELEEAWRELLAFQHHDNDECEGLCGHVGYLGADRGLGLAEHVLERNARFLATRAGSVGDRLLINTVGWARSVVVEGVRHQLPAFGLVHFEDGVPALATGIDRGDGVIRLRRGDFEVEIDTSSGLVTRVGSIAFTTGIGGLRWSRGGEAEEFPCTAIDVDGDAVVVRREVDGAVVEVRMALAADVDALDLAFTGNLGDGPDGRAHSALMTLVEPDLDVAEVRHDTPYAVGSITGRSTWHRKYPTGDWMTSPQEFETITDAFTALQFVDLSSAHGPGLLWMHDGSQGFHRANQGFWNVLSMRDPWDEHHFDSELTAAVRLLPHDGNMTDARRWKLAQELTRPAIDITVGEPDLARYPGTPAPELPAPFVTASDDGAAVTAVYRDSDYHATGFPDHVNRIAPRAALIRVVELDGRSSTAVLAFGEAITRAWSCTSLGEIRSELPVGDREVRVSLRPHEVATIAVELPPAPGDEKTLDDDRKIWATVHRHDEKDD